MRKIFPLLCALVVMGVIGWYRKGAMNHPEPRMVTVKAGALPRGSELAKEVVGDFEIGNFEVTWSEWKVVRSWAVTKGYDLAGVGDTYPKRGGDQLPVVDVSWYDVVKWCNARSEMEGKTPVYEAKGTVYRSGEFGEGGSDEVTMKSGVHGYRLPLDAEWEWAARGGVCSRGYEYSGSDVVGEVARINKIFSRRASVVGSKKANELGLYDMSGNVREWVWESRGVSFRRSVWDRVFGSRVVDTFRRLRGGSWHDDEDSAKVSDRTAIFPPYNRMPFVGFRVAFGSAP